MKNISSIKNLRHATGLSQKSFAELFLIPTRTLQKWEIGQATPPPYVPYMIEELLNTKYKDLLR